MRTLLLLTALFAPSLAGCRSPFGLVSPPDGSLASEYERAEREIYENQFPTRDEINSRRAAVAALHSGR